MKSLILASQSEGRKKLLQEAGFDFEVIVSDFDEEGMKEFEPDPYKLVQKLSQEKAHTVGAQVDKDAVIIAGDQMVRIDEAVVGKPRDEVQCRAYLSKLSNSFAECISGYCVLDTTTQEESTGFDSARVYFKKIPPDEVKTWIKTNIPFSKAAGFTITHKPCTKWIKKIEGDRSTVIGLPLHIIVPLVEKLL